MVRLDRIYTGGGDRGMTSLGDGTRVSKTHPRIATYGAVDELNAVLGCAVLQTGLAAADRRLLRRIQNDLFDVGADLCVPRTAGEPQDARLRVTEQQACGLEAEIDARTARLRPLRSFVLPGGRPAAAWLHLARTTCRRAELLAAALRESEPEASGGSVLVYLNRLSDLLFVMARMANDRGRADVPWVPGAGRAATGGAIPRRRVRRERTTSDKAPRTPRGRSRAARSSSGRTSR